MMRLILLLLSVLIATSSQAQTRVFRASQIDLEQDRRIQSLEDRLAGIEQSLARIVVPAAKPDPVPNRIQIPPDPTKYVSVGDLKEIGGTVHRLTQVGDGVKWLPAESRPQIVQRQNTVAASPARPTSNRYSTAELKSIAANYRGPREADVSPKSWTWEHLQNDHGFTDSQVSGLSLSEALTIHSMAHGGRIKPYRSTLTSAPMTVAPTSPPPAPIAVERKTYAIPQSGCPDGQCPTARTRTTRPRFRLFGR